MTYHGKHTCDVKQMSPAEREFKLALLTDCKKLEAAEIEAKKPKKKA